MNEDGKIYITISDTRGSGGPENPKPEKEIEKKSDWDVFKDWASQKLINEGKYLVSQAINTTVNNIGNFTGDFQAQRDIQNLMSIMSDAASIGGSVAGGFIVAGVPGAIVSGVVVVGNAIINKAINYQLSELERKRQNYSIDILRQRAGLNQLYDGSRGTEN